jgi:hypothetical protein
MSFVMFLSAGVPQAADISAAAPPKLTLPHISAADLAKNAEAQGAHTLQLPTDASCLHSDEQIRAACRAVHLGTPKAHGQLNHRGLSAFLMECTVSADGAALLLKLGDGSTRQVLPTQRWWRAVADVVNEGHVPATKAALMQKVRRIPKLCCWDVVTTGAHAVAAPCRCRLSRNDRLSF